GGSGTSKAKWKSYFFRYFLAGFFVLTGLTAAYLFNFQKVGYFIDSFHFSMSHNRNGHMTSMFGQFSETGFWYFYIVLFLFKTPIPTLLCMVMAARSWFRNTDLFWVFIGPTLLLFALLTHANVQLGYRYFLPGWALLYTATSIAVGKVFTEGKLPFDRKWLIPIAGAFVGSLLAVDLCALIGSSYFPYFNALTPRPSRNFVDANIDWRQGIPRHLLGRVENSLSAADLPNFIRDPKLERARFLVGPSELAGFWGSSFGPQLRAFEPESIVAGFELTSVSRNDLYLLLRHKKPRNTDWTRNGLHDVSVPLSDFRALERHCPTGSRLRTFSRELPVSSESASEEQLHPGSEVVILVQSNLPPEVRVNGELVIPRAISGHAGLVQVQWVSFVPKAKMNQFQIRFSATPASSSAFLLWQECDQSAL
ncbi:MAG: hypothetical protein ACXWP5_03295, partial [Bdellovibrionota bacterium]